jgi:hypothetical protein
MYIVYAAVKILQELAKTPNSDDLSNTPHNDKNSPMKFNDIGAPLLARYSMKNNIANNDIT